MEWALEIALIFLLGATLYHALRLERALGVLKQDRSALQDLIANFNASTRSAEEAVARLALAGGSAELALRRQVDAAAAKQDELRFLTERAETAAERLDGLIRGSRPTFTERDGELRGDTVVPLAKPLRDEGSARRSRVEQELMRALKR